MHIMTRVGKDVWTALGNSEDFVRGMHTVGYPLPTPTTADVPWPCNKTKYISHFPRRAKSGPTAPATAATRFWARSATRCASLR